MGIQINAVEVGCKVSVLRVYIAHHKNYYYYYYYYHHHHLLYGGYLYLRVYS